MIETQLLHKLLRYEPETGKLFWLRRPAEMFSLEAAAKRWNTKNAGREALASINTNGYCAGGIFGKPYMSHRVIWAMQTGAWPQHCIDHINLVRNDNRWGNLRQATRAENNRNTKSRQGSTSSYLGVCWNNRERKWQTQINGHGKNVNLGLFHCEIEAAKAYDAAAIKYHKQFASLNFPAFERAAA